MTNRASSFGATPAIPARRGYGGRLTAMDELPLSPLGDSFVVNGNGTVTRLPPWPRGVPVWLSFVGAPTFVHSSRLLMPGGQSYLFSDGDSAAFASEGDGAWRCLGVFPAAKASPPILVASVASNALTIALKSQGGGDPSSSNPVTVSFRDPNAALGSAIDLSITAPLSLTISSGSTLGTANNTAFRLWAVLFNDGGAPRLGLIKASTPSTIYPLPEFDLRSSTAVGGAGAADSAGVIYTDVAVSGKPYRILAFLTWEAGLATAGAWNAGPTTIQMFGRGSPRPGAAIQSVSASTTSNTSTASPSYIDTALTAPITPISAANMIAASWFGALGALTASKIGYAQLHRNGAAIGLVSIGYADAGSVISSVANSCWDAPQSIAEQTYTVKIKVDTGGSALFPNSAAGGGMQLTEVMG